MRKGVWVFGAQLNEAKWYLDDGVEIEATD